MENKLKHEPSDENRSNEVGLIIADITTLEGNDRVNMQENDLEEQSNNITQSYTARIKTEPVCEENYVKEKILSHWEDSKTNVRLKTVLQQIKKEKDMNVDILQYESNNNNNTNWANPKNTDLIKEVVGHSNENSNSSYDFIENYIKVETDNETYLSESIFDQQSIYALVKDDIEFEHHFVSSGPLTKISTRTDKGLFECNLCDYKTHAKSNLKVHSAVHEDPSRLLWYFCTKCNYKTRQKGHLRRHDLIHRQPLELELFTCAVCDYKFKQKCTLKRHIYNVHSIRTNNRDNQTIDVPSLQIYRCSHCSYATKKKGLLMSHLDKHKDVRDVTSLFICDICSFSTKYRRNLRVHFDTHKETRELQIYECKICAFKTRMGYCLKRHFLSKKHLRTVGKLEDYCPRTMKLKREEDR